MSDIFKSVINATDTAKIFDSIIQQYMSNKGSHCTMDIAFSNKNEKEKRKFKNFDSRYKEAYNIFHELTVTDFNNVLNFNKIAENLSKFTVEGVNVELYLQNKKSKVVVLMKNKKTSSQSCIVVI